MKRLFKRSATVLLVLVLIFSMTAMSVSAFTPPGLARKLQASEQEQVRHQWHIFNEEGLAQFFRLMPPGLRGKFIPPGLLEQGYTFPPGIMEAFGDNPDNWPPGIRMRFGDAVEWDEKDDDQITRRTREVENYTELRAALRSSVVNHIILMDDIVVENTLVINRKLTIASEKNEKWMLEAAEDFEGWLIEVRSTGRLTLKDVILDGFKADDKKFEGLVKVAQGGELTAEDNLLQYAPVGFGLLVDEYNEGDEDLLLDDNDYDFVGEEVVFYDADDEKTILFP